MIEKANVRKNFGKSANTYNSAATVQKYMAEKMIQIVEANLTNPDIYEIGCGTGIFTEKLVSKFNSSKFSLVDISENMIEFIKNKFQNNNNIECYIGDAEKEITTSKYDIVASNAVFQWFVNIEEALKNIKNSMNENGKLYFSTFGAKTFFELNDVFTSIDSKYKYSQEFLSLNQLENILKKHFKNVNIKEEFYLEEYNSLMEFFRSIKKIGANSAIKDKPDLTKKIINKAEELYREKYSAGNKIKVTNHLIFVEAYN